MARCYALTNNAIYTLDKDKQDALGNLISSNTKELKKLQATLPDWLYDIANAFLKKAADTLSLS